MASSNDNVSMALFCDFENVALGVRDANYEKFDIKPVLERLLLKGSIVVKKAYCDWDRYKAFKSPMHEANFELIEIPHVRMSGKNSADIRMVVDALDLCYTKSHVNTFVIISGDSDFSPLVSKLRENAKKVIGVGVKDSTSDLLVANCDEFIFYDDLVREIRRQRKDARDQQQPKRSPEEEKKKREEMDRRRGEAVDIAFETFDALIAERGDSGKIWASVLKEAIKRRKPDFNEAYYGFRTFGNLLEEMKARGLLEFGRDEKSGAYVYRGSVVAVPAAAGESVDSDVAEAPAADAQDSQDKREGRRGRGNRGGRNRRGGAAEPVEALDHAQPVTDIEADEVAVALESAAADYASELQSAEAALHEMARDVREARRARDAAAAQPAPEADAEEEAAPEQQAEPAEGEAAAAAPKRSRTSARKPAAAKKPRAKKTAAADADAAADVEASAAEAPAAAAEPQEEAAAPVEPAESAPGGDDEGATAASKRAKKPGTHKAPARSRLPRKPKAKAEG
ncbi:NYN domain-containing protein [Pseudoduganella flava]|uniref:NYN domain-containing protein n=1 Tax=Pseudoduganella flava TaxID=871742 RepID=A0A562PLU4_9BURK|nr:NYN domain-containing protein [Pseudoduganella flava]QGZ40875.1 NYN domain-containing protein [Pseudoduganella flava]TWI45452.1 NYN domain-containing protein [Pseudoduganella flava]